MAKVNVNSATRDDLVNVAGLRPEIADAVLEFRRKHHRITDAQALEELPGVGPATVEQLRKALDFGDKGGNGTPSQGGRRGRRRRAPGRPRPWPARVPRSSARSSAPPPRPSARWPADAAEGVAELGRLWVDLLGEQTRHNLEVATALGRAVRWDEVVQAQGEFVRVSLERLHELNRRYLEIVRGMMEAAPAAVERARKAD